MRKDVFIDLVLIKVNGGVLNDESSTWRADIRAYAPAAINYVNAAAYNINIKTEGTRDFSGLFYGFYPTLSIQTDTVRNNWKYIVPPKGTIPLPSNQGIRFITDTYGNTYKPLSDNGMHTLNHYNTITVDIPRYRLTPGKIYLFNVPPLVTTVDLTQVTRFEDLDMEDELPIQAGLEDQAIDLCVAYVTGERQTPADRTNDERDIN